MLRLKLSDELERLRKEVRRWLESHTPPVESGGGFGESLPAQIEWQRQLAEARLIAVHWPEQYGGRGLTLAHEAVVQEELARVRAPQIPGLFGVSMVGPVLIRHGNEEQRRRFLPGILSGEAIWCQGFSEPEAGSDLAAVRTRAAAREQEYLISGQKVWTSLAHVAHYCFLLARTADTGRKHEGLSYILVPMNASGISVRPLKQITGDQEFNEVFFDNVSVARDNLVGMEGDGWKIAIATLMHERVILTFARHLQSENALGRLLQEAPASERGRLAKVIAESCAVRALAFQHLLEYVEGKSPGPEGSLDKLLWSESYQRIAALQLELASADENELDRALYTYLYSRGRTIAAGTSEIQRSIIAERVLELPRK